MDAGAAKYRNCRGYTNLCFAIGIFLVSSFDIGLGKYTPCTLNLLRLGHAIRTLCTLSGCGKPFSYVVGTVRTLTHNGAWRSTDSHDPVAAASPYRLAMHEIHLQRVSYHYLGADSSTCESWSALPVDSDDTDTVAVSHNCPVLRRELVT